MNIDPVDFQIREHVWRAMMAAYAHLGVANDCAWTYRPLGFHRAAMRKVALAALADDWGPERVPFHCPPVDFISFTVAKWRREQAAGVLQVPD